MFASLKRLTKHSAVYGLSLILARSISFLLLPLHTHVFSQEAYGLVNLAFAYLAVVAVFYNFGFDSAFLRFYLLSDDHEERRRIFSTAYHAIALIGAALSAIGWIAAPALAAWYLGSTEYSYLMKLCAGILLFDALATLPFLILRAEERSRTFAALKIANVAFNFALNYFFIIRLEHGIAGVFEANLIASIFSFVILGRLALRHLGWQFRFSMFKELFAFGLPVVPSILSLLIIDNISRVMIERHSGLAAVGLFSAGYKLGMIMSLMVAAFRFAWQPFFLSISKQEDAKPIFSRVLTYFTLVCSVIFLGISFFVDDLVRFDFGGFRLLGEEYWQSTAIVPTVLLAYFFYGTYTIFVVGVQIEKKTIYLPLITGIGAAVNIVSNYVLIPLLGMIGAAWAALLAYLAMAASLYIISQRFYPIEYEWKRIAKLAISVFGLFVVERIFALPLIGRAGLLIALPIVLYILKFFHASELKRLKKTFTERHNSHQSSDIKPEKPIRRRKTAR